jgi:hypothetical protein
LPAFDPLPEDIVLTPSVDADHGPHAVIVRRDCHAWRQDDIEDGERGRMVELLHGWALGLAKASQDEYGVGNRLSYDFADVPEGRVSRLRRQAICDEPVGVNHGACP